MTSERFTLPTAFGPALLLCFLLGWVITYQRGAYSPDAVQWVAVAVILCLWSFAAALGSKPAMVRSSPLGVSMLCTAIFAMLFHGWNDPEIVLYAVRPWDTGRGAQLFAMALLLTYLPWAASLREPRFVRHGRFALFSVAFVLIAYDTLKTSPFPRIDVWDVQMQAVRALLNGTNPFTHVAVRDTGPRVAADVPFVYPPTQIYLTLPGYLLGGDVRYSMATAALLCGWMLRAIAQKAKPEVSSIVLEAPALFLWFSPKLPFVLEQSWVDPIQLLLILLAVAAHLWRRRTLEAVLFGIVLTSKQTMFWAFLLAAVLLRFNRRQWGIALCVGGAMVLPFALIDFSALKHANFDFVSALPARPDALTLNNWARYRLGWDIPGNVAFLLAGLAAGMSAWRMRGIDRLGIALLFTYLLFFAFNRWAFANYYFLLTGLAALSAALCFHAQPNGEAGPAMPEPS